MPGGPINQWVGQTASLRTIDTKDDQDRERDHKAARKKHVPGLEGLPAIDAENRREAVLRNAVVSGYGRRKEKLNDKIEDADRAYVERKITGDKRKKMLIGLGEVKQLPMAIRPSVDQLVPDEIPPVAGYIEACAGIKLKEEQKKIPLLLRNRDGLIAAWDVGTGKTLMAMTAAALMLTENRVRKVIFVVPKKLRDDTVKAVCSAGLPHLARTINRVGKGKDNGLWVLTHNQFATMMGPITDVNQLLETIDRDEVENARVEISDLRDHQDAFAEFFKDAMLVVDEAHLACRSVSLNDKTNKGMLTVSLLLACALSAKRLLLTATPAPNKSRDILDLLCMAAGVAARFKMSSRTTATNEFSIHADVDPGDFQRRVSDYVTFLPPANSDGFPRLVLKREAVMVDENSNIEDKERLRAFADETGRRRKEKTKPFLIDERARANELKAGAISEKVLECVLRKEKVVVFSRLIGNGLDLVRKEVMDLAAGRQKPVRIGVMTGKTSDTQDRETKRRFGLAPDNREAIDVLFLSLMAAGFGLTFKGVENAIIVEEAWNYADETQAIGRIRRFESHDVDWLRDRITQVSVFIYQVLIESGEHTADTRTRELREAKYEEVKKLHQLLQHSDPRHYSFKRVESAAGPAADADAAAPRPPASPPRPPASRPRPAAAAVPTGSMRARVRASGSRLEVPPATATNWADSGPRQVPAGPPDGTAQLRTLEGYISSDVSSGGVLSE